MWKTKAAKIAGYVVMLSGLLVIIGWVFGIDWLKTTSPNMISMKFLTAISFVLSGIILVLIVKSSASEDSTGLAALVLPMLSLMVMLIMATIFFSVLVGFDLGFVNMLIREKQGAIGMVYSVYPGLPSIATMVAFFFIALAGLLEPITYCCKKNYSVLIGMLVMIIGAVALVGYIVGIPILFYYVPGKSSAIAISTALLFVIWGMGILLCYDDRDDKNSK